MKHACAAGIATATFLLMASSAAIAQESKQTIASAQQFLNMVLPGRVYSPAYVKEKLKKAQSSSETEMMILGKPTLVNVSARVSCVSNWTFQYPSDTRISVSVRGQGRKYYSLSSSVPELNGIVGDPQGVHWRTLERVTASGTFVILKFRGDSTNSEIDGGDYSLASRVGRALEFLRAHCAETNDTGF
ncbi:hypothetical protein [Massilia glaciei]|uniref:hypothetical protein n=1 Tax=Massilia glaciei TaxID=1524097 RepID=UPI0011B292D9|nr:hypothetical protein [Massilia glaciei]